ncbi:putative ribonuclease H-like domain-containing protein [Tanacetum coccineum]
MKPFGCHVTILNTLDSLGKFDGKSNEGFFVGYSLSSKAFRVYNIRTRRVEENLHIGFLENKPMIEGNGPKWLFDIDSLTQSMNYVAVAAGTIINESADASYFDSLSKDVEYGEPKSAVDDQKQVEDGLDNENGAKDKSNDDSSPKEVNTAGQHVNTTSPDVNTGSFKLNTIGPSVNTASSYNQDSPKDMFTMGAIPTTPNTRIHKDHPIENMIGDVKLSVQTRRMTKPTSKQGFLSTIEPTSIAKALSDSSWVEAMQEELLQFKLQQVWILVDLPIGKRAIGTKWSAFLYGFIEEEVYITQPPGFKDPGPSDKNKCLKGEEVDQEYDMYLDLRSFEVKHEWKDMLYQKYVQKNQTHLGISKEVGTPRYLSLVVPLKKVGDEAAHKELGDRMERATTTASSLEAEQDSGSGPRCQDTILGDVNAQTRFEIASKQSNDPPLSRGYTLRSGEDINAAKHTVSTAGILSAAKLMLASVNDVRHILMLPVQVPAAEGVSINTSIKGFTYFFIRFH